MILWQTVVRVYRLRGLTWNEGIKNKLRLQCFFEQYSISGKIVKGFKSSFKTFCRYVCRWTASSASKGSSFTTNRWALELSLAFASTSVEELSKFSRGHCPPTSPKSSTIMEKSWPSTSASIDWCIWPGRPYLLTDGVTVTSFYLQELPLPSFIVACEMSVS